MCPQKMWKNFNSKIHKESKLKSYVVPNLKDSELAQKQLCKFLKKTKALNYKTKAKLY